MTDACQAPCSLRCPHIKQSPSAAVSWGESAANYASLAQEWHPDKQPDNSAIATRVFQHIQARCVDCRIQKTVFSKSPVANANRETKCTNREISWSCDPNTCDPKMFSFMQPRRGRQQNELGIKNW